MKTSSLEKMVQTCFPLTLPAKHNYIIPGKDTKDKQMRTLKGARKVSWFGDSEQEAQHSSSESCMLPVSRRLPRPDFLLTPYLATEDCSCSFIVSLDGMSVFLTIACQPNTSGKGDRLGALPEISSQGKHSPPPGSRLPFSTTRYQRRQEEPTGEIHYSSRFTTDQEASLSSQARDSSLFPRDTGANGGGVGWLED